MTDLTAAEVAQAAATTRWGWLCHQIRDNPEAPELAQWIAERDQVASPYPNLRSVMHGQSEDGLADLLADTTHEHEHEPVVDCALVSEPATVPEPEHEPVTTATPTPPTATAQPEPAANDSKLALDNTDDDLDELMRTIGAGTVEPPPGKIQRWLDNAAPAVDTTLATRIANQTRSSRLSAEEAERESHPKPPSKPKWTRLPWDVFRSPQFLALDQPTQLLLYQVSHEVWRSNGYIKLTHAELGRWGWRGHSTAQKAIREAVAFKFFRITKPGNAAAGKPTFYFPTWAVLPGEKAAPNTWKTIAPKAKTSKRKPKPAAATPITKAA